MITFITFLKDGRMIKIEYEGGTELFAFDVDNKSELDLESLTKADVEFLYYEAEDEKTDPIYSEYAKGKKKPKFNN